MRVYRHPYKKDLFCALSPVMSDVREPTKKDMDKFFEMRAYMPSYVDLSIKPLIINEGWMSHIEGDRAGDIIEPKGWIPGLPMFMQNPALLFNHSWDIGQPGIWLSVEVREEGLYGVNAVYDTALGRDVALSMRAGLLRSYSVSFNPTKYERVTPNEGEPYFHFFEQELIECSSVSSPMNVNAYNVDTQEVDPEEFSIQSFVRRAIGKGIELKTLKAPDRPGIGVRSMELKEVKEATDALGEKVTESEIKVKDLGTRMDGISQVLSELKQASDGGKKSTSELRELVDKAQADFLKANEELQAEMKKLRTNRVVYPGFDFTREKMNDLLLREPSDIKKHVPEAVAKDVLALQELQDRFIMVDRILECQSMNEGRNYHLTPRAERLKGLRTYNDYLDFRKAMDTATSTEGAELVPTLMSGSLIEQVRLEQVLAPLFPEINMPSGTFTLDLDLGDTIATLAGQTTTIVNAFETTEQTPATANISLTAKKARGRIQLSTEINEDAIVAVLPLVQPVAVRSIARAEDRAIANGDDTSGTHIDSGYTVATSDFRKAWDGLRQGVITKINSGTLASVCGVDGATYGIDKIRTARGQMGKYGLYPSDLTIISSLKAYLLRMLQDIEYVQTLDKYGPNAVILQGELSKVDGIPIVVTEWLEETQNAAGIYAGADYTRSSQILVHRRAWVRGLRRGTEVLVERDLANDVYQVYAYKRSAFGSIFTPSSSDITTNLIYNIDVAA
jgi:HK97 family phage major capsid protein/HK97 family phage prohead protease